MTLAVRGVLATILLASASAGCEPTFSSEGTLTIDGAAFRPSVCNVLVGATGIELFQPDGARLVLTLPPARLDAFHELTGAPEARYEAPGKPAVDLGACGTLTLRGEGYHANRKRAASGHMSLACSAVRGDLTFKGCF